MSDLHQNATDALSEIREAQKLFEKHEGPLGEDGENIAGLLWCAEVYLSAVLEGGAVAIRAAETLRKDPRYRDRRAKRH